MNTGIIILAAGSSSRLGRSKQSLLFNGKTLLQNTIDESAKSTLGPIIVVLGANAEELKNSHQFNMAKAIINQYWRKGMTTSIRAGLKSMLEKNSNVEDVIITVSDQPFLNNKIFKALNTRKEQTQKSIIASDYAQTMGVPALFNKKFFDQLMDLKGEDGAKKLFELYPSEIATISFENGNIDIDTEEDYKNLLNQQII